MESTVISKNEASEQLRENAIHSLWEVTNFVAKHTSVNFKGGHTHNILETLGKLREEISELDTLE